MIWGCIRTFAVALGAACVLPTVSFAEYPDRPIRFIVPQAPGSATDVAARGLAARLQDILKQPVIVDDKPGASGQLGAHIGMDASFMQKNRRGFSTFELILRTSAVLPLDAPYLIETGLGSFGSSSMRMIHRLTHAGTGAEIARLSQYGVNLDLDARRPARWPDDIRAKAERLVVPDA